MNKEPAKKTEKTPIGNHTVRVVSFGFKNGPPPLANLVLDLRFLKNPYWVENLRPLSGLDAPVAEYVLEQELAQEVLMSLEKILAHALPAILSVKANSFTVALGCTGGQHRSTAMVEALAARLARTYPQYCVRTEHRELDRVSCENTDEKTVRQAIGEIL